tara:strand:- start:249 stop:404 length:156 start_codon:yes stop_codon:yes gene_type:complete
MNWLKDKLKKKIVKRVIALAIAAGLSYVGLSTELAQEFSKEAASVIVDEAL